MRPALLLLLLLMAAPALAGCGGKHTSVADCLNGKGFLVQGGGATVRGSSAGGVSFTLRIYGSPAAARRAHARKPQSTTLVGSAVVDFSHNPPGRPGGAPPRLSKRALAEIRSCVTSS